MCSESHSKHERPSKSVVRCWLECRLDAGSAFHSALVQDIAELSLQELTYAKKSNSPLSRGESWNDLCQEIALSRPRHALAT